MGLGRDVALEIRSIFGIRGILTDTDLTRLLDHYGVRVESHRFKSRLHAVISDGVLLLQQGMVHQWKRWDQCHELLHHLRHAGCQADQPSVLQERWEIQADEFAGYLIFGETPLRCCCGMPLHPWVIAELGEVPEECVRRWWCLVERSAMA